MPIKLIYNPINDQFEFAGATASGAAVYPVNYANETVTALPATGAPYAPDGYNLTDNQTVLFTGITTPGVTTRGVYRATVVAGNVTAWTRVVYNPFVSPSGEPADGDRVVATMGDNYADHIFQCTSTPLATFIDTGGPDCLNTLIEVTGVIASGTTIDASASGVNYTKSGDTPDLDISSAKFNKARYIGILLNGVMMRKGGDVTYVSKTSFVINQDMDNGDEIIIIS